VTALAWREIGHSMAHSSRAFELRGSTAVRSVRCDPPGRQMSCSLARQRPAERAGFQPCLRCRPETAPGSPAWSGTATTVARGVRLIEEGFLDEASVTELADRLGVGSRHLLRLFLRHTGAPPSEIAATRRVQAAKRLIDQNTMGLSDIAFAAGFRSVRRFNDAFRATYGRPPSSFSRGRAVAMSVPRSNSGTWPLKAEIRP
jgi:AraC family transcriptional regulator of adaptative response/methylated-DNA-[protein]-cysteine methyltransferase